MKRAVMMVAAMMFSGVVMGQSAARPLVGAIRWDAWHGERGEPGKAVERALSPKQYQWRVPFFGEVLGEDSVRIDGTAPGVMEKEIAYARQAGLDYWAFVTYAEDSPMSIGLQQYLAADAEELRFCLVTEAPRWKDKSFRERVAKLMAHERYVNVADGRPLLFLGFMDEKDSADEFRKYFDELPAPKPYVVVMGWNCEAAEKWREKVGGDAVSAYATTGNANKSPYGELTEHVRHFWDTAARLNTQLVPIAMAGWDRRPRTARPVPWEKWQVPGEGMEKYYDSPTAEELAGHVGDAVRWVKEHPRNSTANAVLIYAWNENDEGGWLVPTLGEGTQRVDHLREVLAGDD